MNYNFYFDETFHDRKITIDSAGMLNIFAEDKNDSYIGVFWGYENNKELLVNSQLQALEQKYIERFGLSKEFKSTVIGRKNFNLGIRSFNKDTYDYYNDFFEILEGVESIIHVNVVSKVELLVRNIFDMKNIEQMPYANVDSFYYSITKFILTYHSPQLLQALYRATKDGKGKVFQKELLNHLEKVIMALIGIKRKEREVPALIQLRMLVSQYSFDNLISEKYNFVYFQNFAGLIKLLYEKGISFRDVNVVIDTEDKTYRTAIRFPFKDVKQVDSTESIQVRVADQLCGFIGRMMYALMSDRSIKEDSVVDIRYLKDNDLVRKHLLSTEWFELQEKHFNLYKRIYKVLILQQEAYWAAMTWSYADQVVMFYSFIRYMASYETFEDFKQHTSERHAEYYNSMCCADLERHFAEW